LVQKLLIDNGRLSAENKVLKDRNTEVVEEREGFKKSAEKWQNLYLEQRGIATDIREKEIPGYIVQIKGLNGAISSLQSQRELDRIRILEQESKINQLKRDRFKYAIIGFGAGTLTGIGLKLRF
jgi:hypothetical protein